MKMIVCVSENFGIGKNNGLLFSIPEDMKLFRESTAGKVMIMGRSTLDSFPGGKPLKNRINIVLTRNKDFSRDGVTVCRSKEEALAAVKDVPTDDVFVIGGAEIYKMFADECNEALVTKVQASPEADKFFFDIDADAVWRLAQQSDVKEHGGLKFTFCKYIKD